ncbi:MAG: ATP-binding cassette domain-containing protein, partial [Flavobacteriaceae bacterium]|nr:ATP-binding cassette domain-containing protein [Flavobacteriaceae bacterium]
MRDIKIQVNDLSLYYGEKKALNEISMQIPANKVTALIGPSGCGKSTFLRCINRMNDLIPSVKITGEMLVEGIDIYDKNVDVVNIRKKIGMVFQKSNPFPKSIFENVAYGPRINGIKNKTELDEIVETSLKQAAIWDELKDRLDDSAMGLSGGQQQRL